MRRYTPGSTAGQEDHTCGNELRFLAWQTADMLTPGGPVLWKYTADSADQLTGAAKFNAAGTSLLSRQGYTYDAAGNLTGFNDQQSVTTGVFNSRNQFTARNSGGMPLCEELWGAATDTTTQQTYILPEGQINCINTSGTHTTRRWYSWRDHLGSVRGSCGNHADLGAIARSYRYDPWRRSDGGGGAVEPRVKLGFTGHYQHSTGLLLAPFCAYDPNRGRWLSEDPIGMAGGLNLYGYVGRPGMVVDPLGLFDIFTDTNGGFAWDWPTRAVYAAGAGNTASEAGLVDAQVAAAEYLSKHGVVNSVYVFGGAAPHFGDIEVEALVIVGADTRRGEGAYAEVLVGAGSKTAGITAGAEWDLGCKGDWKPDHGIVLFEPGRDNFGVWRTGEEAGAYIYWDRGAWVGGIGVAVDPKNLINLLNSDFWNGTLK